MISEAQLATAGSVSQGCDPGQAISCLGSTDDTLRLVKNFLSYPQMRGPLESEVSDAPRQFANYRAEEF